MMEGGAFDRLLSESQLPEGFMESGWCGNSLGLEDHALPSVGQSLSSDTARIAQLVER